MRTPETTPIKGLQSAVHTSFVLSLPPEEAQELNTMIEWFDEIVLGEASDLEVLLDHSQEGMRSLAHQMGNCLGLRASAIDGGVLVTGSGLINLPGFAVLLQTHFSQCLPTQITWASTGLVCTGGWMIVERGQIHSGNASDAMSQITKDLARNTPPTAIQLEAAAAYKKFDDGMLECVLQDPPALIRQTLTSPNFGDLLAAYIWAECSDAQDFNDAAEHLHRTGDQLQAIAEALQRVAASKG